MPRITSPEMVAELPFGYPLAACGCHDCREAFGRLSSNDRMALWLDPRSSMPGEGELQQLVAQANSWARNQEAYMTAESEGGDRRAALRNVRRAMYAYRWRTRDTGNHNTGEGTGNVKIMRQWGVATNPATWGTAVKWVSRGSLYDYMNVGMVAVGTPLRALQVEQLLSIRGIGQAMERDAARAARSPYRSGTNTTAISWEETTTEAMPIDLSNLQGDTEVDQEPAHALEEQGPVRQPSHYEDRPAETELSLDQRESIAYPLHRILLKGGRVWSAEVEVDHLSVGAAARALRVEQGQYSTRPDQTSVIAASDSSVDAEIKISCLRDGAITHSGLAVQTYETLRQHLALARMNCGHHVHIDGTRAADAGSQPATDAVWAMSQLGRSCRSVLLRLCASGFRQHRAYGATQVFASGPDGIRSKSVAIHGQRLISSARNQSIRYSGATTEFRVPNGTLEPIRGHAYVALAMGLWDLAERAVLDEEPFAIEALRLAEERIAHAAEFTQEIAAQFLIDHLALSDDSFLALAITAHTSPLTSPIKRAFRDRAEGASAALFA